MRVHFAACTAAIAIAVPLVSYADFVDYTTTHVASAGGFDTYQVWARFNEADDVLLNFFDHTTVSGSQDGVVHSDMADGSWSASFTTPDGAMYDSFVTMNGLFGADGSTVLDPSFGTGLGATIPFHAGWYTSSPWNPIIAGDVGALQDGFYNIMIMQVTIAAGASGWQATLTCGWKEDSVPQMADFGYGSFAIPAPGALALAGVAALSQRRGARARQ